MTQKRIKSQNFAGVHRVNILLRFAVLLVLAMNPIYGCIAPIIYTKNPIKVGPLTIRAIASISMRWTVREIA